jgi:multiple sugar transport system substrate-binding protein
MVAAVVLAGCTPKSETQTPSRPPSAGGKLKLAIIDDPALGGAVAKLRGEWHGQTGGDFEVVPITLAEISVAGPLPWDAVICPSAQLGELAERDRILPVPKELIDDRQSGWGEIFSLLRVREAAWGNRVMAVPFGSAIFVCYYRPDLLESVGRGPPRTWEEYQELAAALAGRQSQMPAGWHAAIEPLGKGWAAAMLLGRVAAYTAHRENDSTLFQIETMQPLIDRPPFVRALKELIAVSTLAPAEATGYDPAAVRRAFWEGKCGLAITWPTAGVEKKVGPKTVAATSLPVAFAEMPGSSESYSFSDKTWEPRPEDDEPHVPLLAFAGRLGVVSRESKSPDAAFHLLAWLSRDRWSELVSPVTPATTLFRSSHLKNPQLWVEPQVPRSAAAEYGSLVEKVLSRSQRLLVPRIPGQAEYLAALDEAVREAVRDGKAPEEALSGAARRWEQITDRLGRIPQKRAYWRSMGLD